MCRSTCPSTSASTSATTLSGAMPWDRCMHARPTHCPGVAAPAALADGTCAWMALHVQTQLIRETARRRTWGCCNTLPRWLTRPVDCVAAAMERVRPVSRRRTSATGTVRSMTPRWRAVACSWSGRESALLPVPDGRPLLRRRTLPDGRLSARTHPIHRRDLAFAHHLQQHVLLDLSGGGHGELFNEEPLFGCLLG